MADNTSDPTADLPPLREKGDSASRPTSTAIMSRSGKAMSVDEVQKQIGDRYRLEREGGAGGMGQVFAATDTVLGRRVAIKLLHEVITAASDDGSVQDIRARNQLLAEARTMAGLRHPNLCPIHEISLDSNMPFMVMQWIDGLSLRSAWKDLDRDARLAMLVRLLEAVAEIHGNDLVHGDLKPENVMVDRRGEPIVVDFGLARWSRDMDGPRGGTPGYAAPEQLRGRQAIQPSADVYALGVIMFEMLTNRLPYAAASLTEFLAKVEAHDPPLPEEFAPDAPWPLQRICLVALERDSSKRYVDAREMLNDVHRYLRGEQIAAKPSMLTGQFTERVERQLTDVERWRRQGLITEREGDRLKLMLRNLLRPESHWILDARRLSVSQVSLYLGGWLVLIAMSIGMVFAWTALDAAPALRYLTACGTTMAMLLIGVYLQRSDHRRVSLGFQITACLLSPIAVWLLLRETGWLRTAMIERIERTLAEGQVQVMERSREWFDAFAVPLGDPAGLFNRQLLVIALAWLMISVALRWFSRSSSMTPWVVLSAGSLAVAGWANAGMLSSDPRDHALLGAWMAIIGLAGVWPGLYANNLEEGEAVRQGWGRARRYDSWSILGGSLLFLLSGLSLMAWNAGDLYTLKLMDDPFDPSTRAAAFIVNGFVLQLVSHIISGRRRTVVRSRMAEFIRWVSPSHFLAGLVVLQVNAGDDRWMIWLILLALASIVFCYLSILRQWKPFLITGLVYLAVAYVLAFREVTYRLEHEQVEQVELSLLFGMLGLGVVMMLLAWKIPEWLVPLRAGAKPPP